MPQELEEGEMPPLPTEELHCCPASSTQDPAVPSPTDASPPAAPTDSNVAAALSELPSLPSDPPPLPPGEDSNPPDPQTAPVPTSDSATTAPSILTEPTSAAEQASAPESAVQAAQTGGEGLAGPSSEADMEVDMDVDAGEAEEGTSRRPASAEALPSSSGSQRPNWAGFYMAHSQTYPYYGM